MRIFVTLLLLVATSQASALALGPEDFAAAKRLSCVLAQDTLGYLSEDDYADLTDEVLDDYDTAQSDIIYAKALGFYSGLVFGIPERDEAGVQARLRGFVSSQACSSVVGISYRL